MTEDRIKIHGGRISPAQPASPPKAVDIQPQQPARSHAPGETFVPGPVNTEGRKIEPVHPHKPVEPVAKPETTHPARAESLESIPHETTPKHQFPSEPAPSTQSHHRQPLNISKPRRSFGRFITKTLLWLFISVLIILAGALGAIYFYNI